MTWDSGEPLTRDLHCPTLLFKRSPNTRFKEIQCLAGPPTMARRMRENSPKPLYLLPVVGTSPFPGRLVKVSSRPPGRPACPL